MQWTDLPCGEFTGIDWSKGDATKGFDPYLVWAETDNFAGYGLRKPPQWLPLLIEIAEGKTISDLVAASSRRWLRVPSVYRSRAAPTGLRFCTARVTQTFYEKLRTDPAFKAVVRRHELGLPAGSHGDGQEPARPAKRPAQAKRHGVLKGNIIGLIDGGLAFAHANLLLGARARTRYFWRQDVPGAGPAPPELGYGHELTAAEIEIAIKRNTHAGLVDETAVYRHFQMGMELDKGINHGTHVLDIACGPRLVTSRIAGLSAPPDFAPANDDASQCDVIAVQLDWRTVTDTSGGSMTVHILDGLMYILSRCASTTKVVVNLSWGTLAGPHDGSSVLEAAMAQLIALKHGRLRIVLPASNAYQSRLHANRTLPPGGDVTLNWRAPPGDKTQNFLEIWLPANRRDVTVQLTPPGRSALPALAWGKSKMWTDGGVAPLCALIYPQAVAIGEHGTCALVATAPTFSFDTRDRTAPCGVWQVTIANGGTKKVTFDAYIERDDEIIGVRTGALQSRFEDVDYDTSGNPRSFVDDSANTTPIRRSGSFNSIATGAGIDSVGGTRVSDLTWALYSPRSPNPDLPRINRPGVRIVPAKSAPSDENAVLLGLCAAGSRSGSVVRTVGTSDAAPQITRKLFNRL